MRSGVLVLGLLTSFGGCGFSSPPSGNGSGSGSGDDDDMSNPDGCTSFAVQVDTCKLAFVDDLMLTGHITYDTETHVLTVEGTAMPVPHMTLTAKVGEVDAIFGHNVQLTAGAGLRATGPLPFAIIASGSLTLGDNASIDVGNGGAGALSRCSTLPGPGGDNADGGGGGGGGGFGDNGGAGGKGHGGAQSAGGVMGNSVGIPEGPLGGCPGARGGMGTLPGGVGGAGGLGGGGLYIAAADHIDLGSTAVLTAGGGGGRGGGQSGGQGNAGGGGGGTGGMIWLEAPHVMMMSSARLAANGGAGGEGSSKDEAGHDGDNGLTSTSHAVGGHDGASDGADGGDGGSGNTPGTAGAAVTEVANAGGGGGGGSVGYVHITSPDSHLGSVSPQPQ
jgi:hypothetical protein